MKKEEQGITLIALLITIIVLLILAGISIVMLTGENGIIKQAQKGKEETEKSQLEETIDQIIIEVEVETLNPKLDDIIDELMKEEIIASRNDVNKETGAITTKKPSYIIDGKLDDYLENPITGSELDSVTGTETTNTVVKDILGNQVVVPSGFKVINPTETVPDGIIIEDVDTTRPTVGSQFVWIPVGEVIKKDKTKVVINLGRYSFDNSGNISECSLNYTENIVQNHNGLYKTIIAKDIENFKTKARKGYYIGRYEARDKDATIARTEQTNATNQLVCMPDNYVYNNVSQPQAAELCRNMYSNSNFESDLINSYAWDTAIIFLQEFDNRENKTKPYSKQNSLNTSLATQGTNKLTTQDKICNIFDMASNTFEWSTETYNDRYFPCVARGGFAGRDSVGSYSSDRSSTNPSGTDFHAFRPILYL